MTRPSGSDTWSTPAHVWQGPDTGGAASAMPTIDVVRTPTGATIATWSSEATYPDDPELSGVTIQSAIRASDGAAWGPAEVVHRAAATDEPPYVRLALDSSGTPYVVATVWRAPDSGTVLDIRRDADGWAAPTVVTSGVLPASVRVSDDPEAGASVLLWQEPRDDGNADQHAAHRSTATQMWQPTRVLAYVEPFDLAGFYGDIPGPVAVARSDGRGHALWVNPRTSGGITLAKLR